MSAKQDDIPESVRKVFQDNPHIRKVVTSTEIYWRGLKAYLEDPHREVDSRPHVTMDIEGTRIQLSPPPREQPYLPHSKIRVETGCHGIGTEEG